MMDDNLEQMPQAGGGTEHADTGRRGTAADEPLVDPFFYLPPAYDVTRGDTPFISPKFYTFITWQGQTRYLPKDYEAYKDVWDAWEHSESPSGPQVWEAYSAYLATPREPEPPEHEVAEG